MSKVPIYKEINNAPNWEARINVICQRLRIPDLRSRSGLKKIYKTFPEIYQRLSACYRENSKQVLVLESIVNVYARMCADVLLRDKLLHEGFLTQVISLLDVPACQVGALQCLVSLSHHGGADARGTVAKYTSKLAKLGQDSINDNPSVSEQCLVVLSHATTPVLSPEKLDHRAFKSLGDLDPTFKFVEKLLRQPHTSYTAFSHALLFLTSAANHGRAAFLANPGTLSFLVACLRSTDLQVRASAMTGIMRLQLSVGEKEPRTHDTNRMLRNMRSGCPDVMADAVMDYGMARAESTLILLTSSDFQKAMMRCAQDHDLYALGMRLFELIGRTEFSVGDGVFEDEHGKSIDLGLPFVRWLDALPHCAHAIRARGIPAQADAANVIELKYLIAKSRTAELHALAQKCLETNPHCAFYYYAMTIDTNNTDGLRWAKKGLKCTGPSMTPYVRFGMLFNAVMHAGCLGLAVLEEAEAGEKAWEEGFAILRCAFEDSKTYIAEAPPDARSMASGLLWCTLLSITMRGPELSIDLREIQSLLERQKQADEMKVFLYTQSLAKTQNRLARDMVLKHYASAEAEWGATLRRFDQKAKEEQSNVVIPARSADEGLAAWLEGTNLDEDGEPEKVYCGRSSVDQKALELYRCSNCRNPSAMLKRCVRCAKARYCDVACQKMHWSEHKKICKPKEV